MAASLDPTEVADAVAFRTLYGLRRDLDWLQALAADPRSHTEFPVPLLPFEVDQVVRQNEKIVELVPALEAYGHVFPAFAGVVINGPVLSIRFTRDLDAHRAAIDALFPGQLPIRVELGRYSILELANLAATVEAEREWFATIGAGLFRADMMVIEDSVRLRYIARDLTIEPEIRAHFGDPPWLDLVWYGAPPWDGPTGDMTITIVGQGGKPAQGECTIQAVDPRIYAAGLPLVTDAKGRCSFADIPATATRFMSHTSCWTGAARPRSARWSLQRATRPLSDWL